MLGVVQAGQQRERLAAHIGAVPGGPLCDHQAGQFVRLRPQPRVRGRLGRVALIGQLGQCAQGHGRAGIGQHPQSLCARPQHQRRTLVMTIKRRAFVAGGFLKMLLIGLDIGEGIQRAQLVVDEWEIIQRRR